jgi:glycosyltransferase involved in cell wall biosynthesis
MLKIAIINITAGGLSGGSTKYLSNIIPYLLASNEVSGLLVAVPESAGLVHWQKEYPSVKWVSLKPKPWSFFTNSVSEDEKAKIIEFSPNVIFIPTARFWKLGDIPVVSMVRNMEPFFRLKGGNSFLKKIQLIAQYWVTRNAVLRADRVIAVSGFVKQFLTSRWHISGDNIEIIYHGCKIEKGVYPEDEKPSILPKNIKSKDFLFTAGSICSYRGLEDIIEALGFLKSRNADVPDLLIAGKTIPFMRHYEHNLKKHIDKKGISGKIHWLGELDAHTLGWCYANCALFLMTSRVEACPNIVLEAMSYGCVCVSTNNPPMPELFKDSAVYYKAGDGMVLADTINYILSLNEGKKVEMSQKIRARSAEFSWDKAANGLINELKKAIENKGKR